MGKSMEMLRKEENHWHLECQNIAEGLRWSQRKKYRNINIHLINIVATYNTTSLDHVGYLNSISKCLHSLQ